MALQNWQLFERFVADIFKREGFRAELNLQRNGSHVDLLLTSPTGATAVAEIKLYASRTMPMTVLTLAAAQVEAMRQAFSAQRAILIIGGKVPWGTKKVIQDGSPNLLIYDVDELAFLAAKDHDLLRQLEAFTRESFAFSDAISPVPQPVDVLGDLQRARVAEGRSPIQPELRGAELCKELRSVPPATEGYRQFEKKCTEILKYVLDKDLTAWAEQEGSDTGISYYDLIARVSSTHDFWLALVNHFHSRYVIFEFKNYTGKIGQGQIYTTEKYLFQTALRSTAFIISREGADHNGLAAARGALREHGKLIVNLTSEHLCQMLKLKDSAGDPSSVLVGIVDEMLIKLER